MKQMEVTMSRLILILTIILLTGVNAYPKDMSFTQEDRDRLIRLEEKLTIMVTKEDVARMATKEDVTKIGERLAFVDGRVEVIGYIALGIFATVILTLISIVYAAFYKYPKPAELESLFSAIEEREKRFEAELELERQKRISLEQLVEEMRRQQQLKTA